MMEPEKKFVIYNGVSMVEGWPEQIQDAQNERQTMIDGIKYDRIRFGKEIDNWGADKGPCHDCAVLKGQFHVPGCDVERCPKCEGQAISCDCIDSEDEDE